MRKILIFQAIACNKVINKLFQQQTMFPCSVGFKLFHISKKFDEIEEYVFGVMEKAFQGFNIEEMTDEQTIFYNTIISTEIEVEYEQVNGDIFRYNDNLMLTLQDIEDLSVILTDKE